MKTVLTLKASENGVDKVLILWSGRIAAKLVIPAFFNGLDGISANLGIWPIIHRLDLEE